MLRELAVSAPTFFFQQVQPFFDNIFYAVWDPKQAIREGAVSALRACLILTTQRETKEMQKPQWYKVSRDTVFNLLIYLLFIFAIKALEKTSCFVLGDVTLSVCVAKQQTFEEAEKGFDETLAKEKGMNRDDRVHGALLILNELVRISSMEGEVSSEIKLNIYLRQEN